MGCHNKNKLVIFCKYSVPNKISSIFIAKSGQHDRPAAVNVCLFDKDIPAI